MTRHDEALLWEYAARELPSEDARLVQHHLTECPECQEKLSDVRTAQGALKAARTSAFEVSYGSVDTALSMVIDRKLQGQAVGRRWVLGLSSGLVAVGLALVAFGLWSRWPVAAPTPVAVQAPVEAPRVIPLVESAVGLMTVGASPQIVAQGNAVASGDVLRTGPHGRATLRLPEGTRLGLAGDTQLALTRVQADEVALGLEHGRVSIAASHARRKSFVVLSGGAMVTVVGTVFSVAATRDTLEVAVEEGRVSVETPAGLPQLVNAGQRVQFDTRKWRSVRGALPGAEKRDLQGFVASAPAPVVPPTAAAPMALPIPIPIPAPVPVVAEPARVVPPQAMALVPAAGGAPTPAAPKLNELIAGSMDGMAPRSAAPAAAPGVVASAKPGVLERAVAPEAKGQMAPPDMTGLEVPLVVSSVESVGRPPEQREWAEMPKAAEPIQAPAGGPPPTPAPSVQQLVAASQVKPPPQKLTQDDGISATQAAIFMDRAERSLSHGTCDRYMIGLDDVASGGGERAEMARVTRARCFDATNHLKQANAEYRHYLQQFPNGRFVEEARQVISELP